MKSYLAVILSGIILCSGTLVIRLQSHHEAPETMEAYEKETLSTSTNSSDFRFSQGVITGYLGTSAHVTVPATIGGVEVTTIAMSAFQGKQQLVSVVLPDTVTVIEKGAFSYCTQLASVELPSALVEIKDYAFRGCSALQEIHFPEALVSLGDAVFADCTALTAVTFPEGLEEIGQSAFQRCTSLTAVALPDSVHSLGDSAFAECHSLEDLVLSANLTTVPYQCFYNCSSLQRVEAPFSARIIEEEAFYNCGTWEHVILHENLQQIEEGAFSLTEIPVRYFTEEESLWYAVTVGEGNEPVLEARGFFLTAQVGNPHLRVNDTLPEWSWAYTDFVLDNGIMPDLTRPSSSQPSPRGLVVETLYNYCGEGAVVEGSHSFTDIDGYEIPLAWIYDLGIMGGRSETEFDTESPVTRQEFALILYQLALSMGKPVSGNPEVLAGYPDTGGIVDWAVTGVSWAVEAELMTGIGGYLYPETPITQAQIAVMLYKFHGL